VVDAHAAKIRSLVKNALGLPSDAAVTVEAYDDMLYAPIPGAPPLPGTDVIAAGPGASVPPPPGAGAAARGTANAGIAATPAALLLNAHAREIALVMLGIVALLMLSMVLRRQPAAMSMVPELATVPSAVVTTSSVSHDRGGGHGSAVLSGTLEEAAVASQSAVVSASGIDGEHEQDAHQMFRRVRDLVAENPGDAAKVLKEWIYQSQQGR
jgi:hypothetical protein